mgnify:CR=1 FL=1
MNQKPGWVSQVIGKLHQHKAKEFGKLRYAPNFEKAKRLVICWDSEISPAETKIVKEYIEHLKHLGKQIIRINYFNVKTKD